MMFQLLSVFLLLLMVGIAYFLITGWQALLPKHVLARIAEVQQKDIPSLIA